MFSNIKVDTLVTLAIPTHMYNTCTTHVHAHVLPFVPLISHQQTHYHMIHVHVGVCHQADKTDFVVKFFFLISLTIALRKFLSNSSSVVFVIHPAVEWGGQDGYKGQS